MSEFYPYFTKDGSVGLYSKDFNDIYHSATGALTEAYEKFIFPSNLHDILLRYDNIKVLDICYGIGYNTKALLNYILENRKNISSQKNFQNKITNKFSKFFKNFSSKNLKTNQKPTDDYAPIYTNKILLQNNKCGAIHTDKIATSSKTLSQNCGAIYSNNISNSKKENCNSSIHGNKSKEKKNNINGFLQRFVKRNLTNRSNHISESLPSIYIKAVDFDKNISCLSPFIKTGEKHYKRFNKKLPNEKINKYLINDSESKTLKVEPEINYLLLNALISTKPEIFSDMTINSILSVAKFRPFFDENIRGIFEFYKHKRTNCKPHNKIVTLLHNIYYQHVSLSYKNRLKTYQLQDINFDLQNDDARKVLLEDSNSYNLIFLDAFTPSKCPCLWSFDFFKQLYVHLEPDGMLLTYSSSASIRGAMIAAGFFIGQIYNERTGQYFGTVATKDETLIKHHLSEFDLGLVKTKAGIFYRDPCLSAQNEAILKEREDEVKNSNRESSSHYKKRFATNY